MAIRSTCYYKSSFQHSGPPPPGLVPAANLSLPVSGLLTRDFHCTRQFGDLGILKRHHLPPPIVLDDNHRRPSVNFARLATLIKLQVRTDKRDGNVRADKPNSLDRVFVMAALVDSVKNFAMPLQLATRPSSCPPKM